MYKRDRYAAVSGSNPDLKVADITKIISDEWRRTVSEETKNKYKSQYETQKNIYLGKMKEHVELYGKPIKKKKKDKKNKSKNKKNAVINAKKALNNKAKAAKVLKASAGGDKMALEKN